MNAAARVCLVSFSSGILRNRAVFSSAKIAGLISIAEVREQIPSSLKMDSLSNAMDI